MWHERILLFDGGAPAGCLREDGAWQKSQYGLTDYTSPHSTNPYLAKAAEDGAAAVAAVAAAAAAAAVKGVAGSRRQGGQAGERRPRGGKPVATVAVAGGGARRGAGVGAAAAAAPRVRDAGLTTKFDLRKQQRRERRAVAKAAFMEAMQMQRAVGGSASPPPAGHGHGRGAAQQEPAPQPPPPPPKPLLDLAVGRACPRHALLGCALCAQRASSPPSDWPCVAHRITGCPECGGAAAAAAAATDVARSASAASDDAHAPLQWVGSPPEHATVRHETLAPAFAAGHQAPPSRAGFHRPRQGGQRRQRRQRRQRPGSGEGIGEGPNDGSEYVGKPMIPNPYYVDPGSDEDLSPGERLELKRKADVGWINKLAGAELVCAVAVAGAARLRRSRWLAWLEWNRRYGIWLRDKAATALQCAQRCRVARARAARLRVRDALMDGCTRAVQRGWRCYRARSKAKCLRSVMAPYRRTRLVGLPGAGVRERQGGARGAMMRGAGEGMWQREEREAAQARIGVCSALCAASYAALRSVDVPGSLAALRRSAAAGGTTALPNRTVLRVLDMLLIACRLPLDAVALDERYRLEPRFMPRSSATPGRGAYASRAGKDDPPFIAPSWHAFRHHVLLLTSGLDPEGRFGGIEPTSSGRSLLADFAANVARREEAAGAALLGRLARADVEREFGPMNYETMELLEPYLELGAERRGREQKQAAIPHLSAEWAPAVYAAGPWIGVCTWLRAAREYRTAVAEATALWGDIRKHREAEEWAAVLRADEQEQQVAVAAKAQQQE